MKTSPNSTRTEKTGGIKVITKDLKSHPRCPHGPTLLFSTSKQRRFFGCSACRDRKQCNFFLLESELCKLSEGKLQAWEGERLKFLKGVNHRKLFLQLNKVKSLPSRKRTFCTNCCSFTLAEESKHTHHPLISDMADYQLQHPSELLTPLNDAKKEAQYLFSKHSVTFLVNCIQKLGFRHVICIGTPRIHEHIQSSVPHLSSILLDFDRRFHTFFGPLEFCWYNMFNNHFFFDEAEDVFREYLLGTKGKDTILITDPPFGGRTEPLVQTFNTIESQFKKLNNTTHDLPIFWIFPYFMEPQILKLCPNFTMLDYKVQYDNHPMFHNGPKGRKQGSPVRIFTNISASQIELPENDYRFCEKCMRWIATENRHCNACGECTSKNGQTYVHCKLCARCVKPNWRHCTQCRRCAQIDHICEAVKETGVCLSYTKNEHNEAACPEIEIEVKKGKKRKIKGKLREKKKFKQCNV